jgi:hypothetical protein
MRTAGSFEVVELAVSTMRLTPQLGIENKGLDE